MQNHWNGPLNCGAPTVFFSSVVQKSSFPETVTTATLKIMSVRFGRLACFPLGPHSILHSSANNRSCSSSRCIVPCPTSHRGERQQSDGGRDTCKVSPSRPRLPAGPSVWHLTTTAVNRPLECHWHSFSLAQFFSGWVLSLSNSVPWHFFKPGCLWSPTVQRGSLCLQPEAKGKERVSSKIFANHFKQFIKPKIFCFQLLTWDSLLLFSQHIIVKFLYLGFRLLVTQNKQFEDITWLSGRLWWVFFTVLCNYYAYRCTAMQQMKNTSSWGGRQGVGFEALRLVIGK